MGDILFTCINLSRHLKIDPETALRKANRKFETRFRKLENLASDQHTVLGDVTQEKLELFWREAKKKIEIKKDLFRSSHIPIFLQ